jgi:gamma-glutamylputrescine oxidase
MNLLYSNDTKGQHANSWYAATRSDQVSYPPLAGSMQADVCIVGAGYTGLSTALHLAKSGLKVVVIEAHRAGWGASGRNGGQVDTGQRLDQDELEKSYGKTRARALWDISAEAVGTVKSLIKTHAIPCDFRPGKAHAMIGARNLASEHKYAEHLATHYGYDKIDMLDQAGLRALVNSPLYAGGTLDHGAGHLHPLNYAVGLAIAAVNAGVEIFEQSLVTGIQAGTKAVVTTDKGSVIAGHIVLACNGYLGDLDAKVAAKSMPINNFIVATRPFADDEMNAILPKDIAVADSKFVVNYFRRSADNRLLFGGAESYGYKFPDIEAAVRKPLSKVYPHLADVKIDYAWGGTLAITMTRMPLFATPKPNVWSASGFSGHGVAMATMAGKIIASAVQGQLEQFDVMKSLKTPSFPGGPGMRTPLLSAAMTWFTLRDRLGL